MGIQSTPLTADATLANVTPTLRLATIVSLQVNYIPLAQLYVHQKPLHRTTQLQPHQARIRRQSLLQQFTANPLTLHQFIANPLTHHQITANPLALHQFTAQAGQRRLQVT